MTRSDTFLLYDSRCGPCSRFLGVVKKLDLRNEIKPVSLYSRLASELVNGSLSKEELMSSFHLVIRDCDSGCTRIFSAGNGVIQLLHYMPAGSFLFPVARNFKPARVTIRWIYKQLAKLRENSTTCTVESGT